MSQPENSSEPVITSVTRALDVLTLLATSPGSCSIQSLSESAKIPSATVFRILNTLRQRGFAVKTKRGEYSIGGSIFTLVSRAGQSMGGLFQDVMRELADATRESASAAMYTDNEVIYVAHQASSQSLRQYARLGSKAPMHATGVGKVLLANIEQEKRQQIIDALDYSSLTEYTIDQPKTLKAQIEKVDKLGYATDEQEQEIGVRCVAVPIPGHPLFAISVSGPVSRMCEEFQETVVLPALRKAADKMSEILSLH